MNPNTKTRLLETSARLFAEHGYRGASVRHICDLARANPGAVSYHFGGKKQLYRTALRRAAAALFDGETGQDDDPDSDTAPDLVEIVGRAIARLDERSAEARLLVRDLSDGGEVAVEALEPVLRSAHNQLRLTISEDPGGPGGASSRDLFIDLAAPLFLLTTAWPVLQRALDLAPDQRRAIIEAACRRALGAHGLSSSA